MDDQWIIGMAQDELWRVSSRLRWISLGLLDVFLISLTVQKERLGIGYWTLEEERVEAV